MNYPRLGVLALALAVVVVGVTGCPASRELPFDASGAYEGAWQGEAITDDLLDASCSLSLDLNHAINLPMPFGRVVLGTATVEYDCLDLPGDENLPSRDVDVFGLMDTEGNLRLQSRGCRMGGACTSIELDGAGEDTTGDGLMDLYSGSFDQRVHLSDATVVEYSGTFEVTRVE